MLYLVDFSGKWSILKETINFTHVHVPITLNAWVACFGKQDVVIERAEMDIQNDETNKNSDRTQQNRAVFSQQM